MEKYNKDCRLNALKVKCQELGLKTYGIKEK